MITRAKVKLGKGEDHTVLFNQDTNLPEPLIRRALAHTLVAVDAIYAEEKLDKASREKLVGFGLSFLLAQRPEWYSAGKDKAGEEPIAAKILADFFA